ncbi:MAG: hypothetical protein REI78_06070 [Pedobacter sp.]|nr:hypothetical protein [Pedobacter sp.]MDQ8052570.1 hypothetical protein [Pedobacter sp.]
MKKLAFLFLVFACFAACTNHPKEDKTAATQQTKSAPRRSGGLTQQDSIKATARQVLICLKDKKYNELSTYFSPEGVLFSPYGFIDTLKSKKLIPADFLESINRNWILTWGIADGSGDPIKLTVKAYFQKFVYDADYLAAEAVGYDEIIKKGNTKINLEAVYPHHHFVEYHFSGFDQQQDGLDWTSLRLVFEKRDGQYFLKAVVHDQWTI